MRGILLDSNYQPIITRDGLALGEISPQNQALIIQCHKGEFKETPAIGVGIEDMLLDQDPLYWRQRIREALEIDGQEVERILIGAHSISISAHYTG